MELKRIIVLNLGSTSFKFKYFLFGKKKELLASGSFENIGDITSAYSVQLKETDVKGSFRCESHIDAFGKAMDILVDKNVLQSIDNLDAVAYKAVHAGMIYGARPVDDDLLSAMEKYCPLAPAHNPIYIEMMTRIRDAYPNLRQIAHFETSFHHQIPLKRAVYGVPYEWVEKYGIRKYGFHGASHNYIAEKMHELEPNAKKLISVHLGGSSSICAIYEGKSIATTMGATPQSGLFHNNRVGDFDIFCLRSLIDNEEKLDNVFNILSGKSGFLGLSGISADLRKVLAAKENGDFRAALAVDAFVDNIVGYIGMFSAYLKGIDAIVFTGGIGYKSSIIRSMVCKELDYLGIELDENSNELGREGIISSSASSLLVYVLQTNEELIVARKCYEYLTCSGQ
jgi:acetate kinase